VRPGTRDNPLLLQAIEDLERATRHVHRPSPAQAEAGNYQQAHINIAGLPVTVATPRGALRRGIDRQGVPWEVMMPVDYGHVKRTEGADEEQVDIYIGPLAHEATLHPVWIVDQCDADSGAWDEHKCMIGFPDAITARQAYLKGFSDGRGQHRIGGAVRTDFEAFRGWLKSGGTKKPLVYRPAKSASSNQFSDPYVAAPCPSNGICTCGGSMSATATPPAAEKPSDPRALGNITKILSRVLGFMPAADRIALMQDAAAMTTDSLATAKAHLGKAEGQGVVGELDDLWDGPPDSLPRIDHAHGPGSTAASDSIITGPSQSASGDGAMRMERQYSSPAPQGGVMEATTRLGRQLVGLHKAVVSVFGAVQGHSAQLEVMKAGIATIPDPTALQTMIETAVAKAIKDEFAKSQVKPKAVVAKADDEDDKDDEESKQSESRGGGEEDEADEDDEDKEKHASIQAAKFRLMAKSRVKWAKLRIAKAVEQITEDKQAAAAHMLDLAEINLAKATGYVEASQALQEGRAGLSTQTIRRDIAKARKTGIGEAQAQMQTKWPASTEREIGKGPATETTPSTTPAPVTPPTGVNQADLVKAMEQIQAAASGMGMLQASVGDLMKALSGTHAGGSLPPVFALAKAAPEQLKSREAELQKLRDDKIISFDDHDRAQDAIMRAKMNLPEDIVQQLIARLPEPARAVLTRSAA
jgi:hypothetical protein